MKTMRGVDDTILIHYSAQQLPKLKDSNGWESVTMNVLSVRKSQSHYQSTTGALSLNILNSKSKERFGSVAAPFFC